MAGPDDPSTPTETTTDDPFAAFGGLTIKTGVLERPAQCGERIFRHLSDRYTRGVFRLPKKKCCVKSSTRLREHHLFAVCFGAIWVGRQNYTSLTQFCANLDKRDSELRAVFLVWDTVEFLISSHHEHTDTHTDKQTQSNVPDF